MGKLIVELYSKAELIEKGIVTKIDNTMEDEVGGSEYCTDVVSYRANNRETVVLASVVKDDELTLGDLWLTEDGLYIHSSWIKPEFKVTNSGKYIQYNGETYTISLNKSKVQICINCACSPSTNHGYCRACYKQIFAEVNNYSYKPTPIFYGEQLKNDRANPVWYGIELEHSATSFNTVADFSYKYNGNERESRFYYKSDASIHSSDYPVEMVTHPHSFKELMTCKWLNNLNKLDVIDDEQTHAKNGCHIHVSSTAFTNDNHYAKWYFFVYSLANGILQRIANRELTRYCKPQKFDNIITKTLEPKSSYDRSVIINEQNNKTKEVRVFSTTNEPKVLKSYIQFMESTIKYSKYAKTVLNYDDYIAYVFKYNTKYQELIDVVNGLDNTVKPRAIVVPKSTNTVYDMFDVPNTSLHLITNITVCGDDYKVYSLTIDFISENIRLNGSSYDFKDIKRITYAY